MVSDGFGIVEDDVPLDDLDRDRTTAVPDGDIRIVRAFLGYDQFLDDDAFVPADDRKVSEKDGGAMHYAERVRKEYPQYNVRVSILGHLQRGGKPTAYDRILASRMGVAAIEAFNEGQRNVMIGIKDDKIVYVPIARAVKINRPIEKELISVLSILST